MISDFLIAPNPQALQLHSLVGHLGKRQKAVRPRPQDQQVNPADTQQAV
jgi:hypothetical protein